jgi:hypothetical protein
VTASGPALPLGDGRVLADSLAYGPATVDGDLATDVPDRL